eukprot:scaffold202881_cov21-Tisochrysis_lutea.AAC.1
MLSDTEIGTVSGDHGECSAERKEWMQRNRAAFSALPIDWSECAVEVCVYVWKWQTFWGFPFGRSSSAQMLLWRTVMQVSVFNTTTKLCLKVHLQLFEAHMDDDLFAVGSSLMAIPQK